MNIKYAIVKNEMPASSTEAKYLGKIIPNGVRNRSQMTALALKSEHFAEATFAAVIDAAVDITQELCAEGHDVDWGTVKFLSKMHGSLPYEDSSFEDGTASLTLDADATNVTRTVLDTLVPVKVSAAEIDSLIKVSNVMDVTTEQFSMVVGSTEFAVLGNGITLDNEGEYVKALDKKTLEVKGTATVLRVSKGQRSYAKFSPQLTGGDYTFEIATKGLIGEATPRVFRKPVTAVYVPPTPVANTVKPETFEDSMREDGKLGWGDNWLVSGTGLYDETSKPADVPSYVEITSVIFTPTGESPIELTDLGGLTPLVPGTCYEFSSNFAEAAIKAKSGKAKVKFVCKTKDYDETIRTDIVYSPEIDVVPAT